MILHTKQECTRFSTLLLDLNAMKEGQRGAQVSHTLTERGIPLAVTTMNVFAEPNKSREQTPAFPTLKEKHNITTNLNSFGSNILEAKIIQLYFSLLKK